MIDHQSIFIYENGIRQFSKEMISILNRQSDDELKGYGDCSGHTVAKSPHKFDPRLIANLDLEVGYPSIGSFSKRNC